MLTKYERELTEYWYNWKPGMPPYSGEIIKNEPEVIKVEQKVELNGDKLVEDMFDRIKDII